MPTPRSFVWAFGLGSKETTFGVIQADASLTDWVTPTEANFADVEISYRTDEEEINGYLGETEHQIEHKKGKVSRKFNGSVEIITWALAMMLGKVTSSGISPNFTHTIKFRDVCTVNPPSFSFVEALNCAGFTSTYFGYKGCVINSISLEVNGKGAVQVTIEIMHDGSETAKAAFTLPASATAVNKLLGSMLTLTVNAVDISSLVRNFKLTLNAGITEPPSIAAGVNVAEYQYGEGSPKLDIEFTFKGDKSHAFYALFQNATVIPITAALTFNANRSISMTATKNVLQITERAQGNETQLVCKAMPEHNTTDQGPGVFTAKTGQATYLVAA
ncbi:MAG: phage tail tube protein [Acidobacteriota bacterium]